MTGFFSSVFGSNLYFRIKIKRVKIQSKEKVNKIWKFYVLDIDINRN